MLNSSGPIHTVALPDSASPEPAHGQPGVRVRRPARSNGFKEVQVRAGEAFPARQVPGDREVPEAPGAEGPEHRPLLADPLGEGLESRTHTVCLSETSERDERKLEPGSRVGHKSTQSIAR